MLELPAGTYPAPQAGLNFVLGEPMRLPQGSCLRLSGENGAGKTTFLEHVLIPALRGRHRLLYLAQDMELQKNAMRTTLALLGHEVPAGLADMVAAWVETGGCREVIILDEFDKYASPEQMEALNLPGFDWVVQVSHLDRPDLCARFAHGFVLAFDRPGGADVNLKVERLWPR